MRRHSRRLPPTAVLDANAIIGLAKADCLALIGQLFTKVIVPPEVDAEILDPLSRDQLTTASQHSIGILQPSGPDTLKATALPVDADQAVLDAGSRNVPCVVVSGDRQVISRAERSGLLPVTPQEVVVLLVESGHLTDAKPHLDLMRSRGYGIEQRQYERLLRRLGELDE